MHIRHSRYSSSLPPYILPLAGNTAAQHAYPPQQGYDNYNYSQPPYGQNQQLAPYNNNNNNAYSPYTAQDSYNTYSDHSRAGSYGGSSIHQNRSHSPAVPGSDTRLGGGERGLGATLIGGAGGAFIGHELGGGALGTIGGIVAGAIGANMLEHRHQEKKWEQQHGGQGGHGGHGHHHHHHHHGHHH